jgi:hypothetical protein
VIQGKRERKKHKKRERKLRFEVVTGMSVRNVVFWDMAPCNLFSKKLAVFIFVSYPEE